MTKTIDHGDRDHASWSASATERNWSCAGALALQLRDKRPDIESEAAAWGTACHQVSEKCLRSGKDAAEFIGTIEKTKAHKFTVDEEMTVTAQEYVDYVRGRLAEYKAATGDDAVLLIEQHFSLTKALKTPFDAGGTGDAVIIFPKWRLIEIVDLKGGRGVVVEVNENKQARTYGLGAVIENAGLDIEKVMSTIVQPRAGHKDGRVRSETYHIADLMEWTAELLDRMKLSKEANDTFDTMLFAAWWSKYLKPGNHCTKTFCKQAATCPALEQHCLDAAGVWFDKLDQPQMSNAPDSMSPAQLAKKLDMFDLIQDWMNAVRRYANDLAQGGTEIYDPETDARYQLSETIGHRKWLEEDDKVREALFLKADLTDDEVYNKKLKSPAQIEAVLGSKRKNIVADMAHRPVTGTSLVRTTKTTRPPVPAAVNKHFSVIE